jgi:hypothetical protein
MMSKSGLSTLADQGLVRAGMVIELVDGVRPSGPGVDTTRFLAEIVKASGGKDSVRWQGELYSPNSLLVDVFEPFHGVTGLWGIYRNWQIVGHAESIHDEAKRLREPGASSP